MLDPEEVAHAFARWILSRKRQGSPDRLYVVGVNGSVGQGKTVFSRAIVKHLAALLNSQEGQAFTRSLDDYYLPKAERSLPEFLSRGYNPLGIPNRGPAGTHDIARLWNDIQAMDKGQPNLEFPAFDKQRDDRSLEPCRVAGKVGIFILEGWFVGARTDVDSRRADLGLRRSVAVALADYKPVFDRLDALWVFAPPPSLKQIVAQRIEQQKTINRETGLTGMAPDQIRRFIDYFYKDAWQAGVTSPTPSRVAASFWAVMDSHHRILKIAPHLSLAASPR